MFPPAPPALVTDVFHLQLPVRPGSLLASAQAGAPMLRGRPPRRHWRAFRFLLPAVLIAVPAAAQKPAEPESITIGGQTFFPCPPERLRAAGLTVPDLPPEQNAFYTYVEAINRMVVPPGDLTEAHQAATKGRWPEGEAGDRLAEWLDRNRPALEEARRALDMPGYYMPMLYSSPAGAARASQIDGLLPALSGYRQLAQLMVVEGAYLQAQGQADAAMGSYLAAHRLGNQIGGNPGLLLEGLVSIAINGLAAQSVTRLCATGAVSTDALKNAAHEMEALAAAGPTWERLISAEQPFSQACIDEAIARSTAFGWFGADAAFMGPGGIQEPGWGDLGRRLKRLYLPDRTMKKHIARHLDDLAEAGRPQPDGTIRTIDEARLFEAIPAWNVIGRGFAPSLSRVMELVLRARSNSERAKLTVAVAAYQAERAQLPPTLAALTPDYISTLSADPFTGAEFDYQATTEGRPAVKGLELITNVNEAEHLKKRKFAAILSPRAARWRRYVQESCENYGFTDAQRTSAEAVLRDVESRAARYEQAEGAKLQQLIEADRAEEVAEKVGPLQRLFTELQKRIDALPTAQQRAAATTQPVEMRERPPAHR